MIRLAGILSCAALAWLALAASAVAADITLRFGAINQSGTASFDEILVPFARGIEADSGGRRSTAMRPLGGFGRPVELLPMVEKGDIEIAATVQGYHPGRFPRTSVMELPLIFDTAEAGSDIFWSLYEEGLLNPEYDAFKVLALYSVPPYGVFVTADYKIASLRDLRGLRVRVASVTSGLALARLGMIPIGMPLNLMGQMLNDKLLDGISYGWDSTNSTVLFEKKTLAQQVSSMVDIGVAGPTLMVVMNRKAYEALAPELRRAIDTRAGRPFGQLSARLRDQAEAKSKDILTHSPDHHIVPLTDAERAEIKQRITPAYDEWIADMKRQNIDGAALLARARALAAHS
jgi:TRAP-type C4-dicarboxylate transport system substrate-binding protein